MIITLLIAISLSMDAFSLSLAYGTLNVSKKQTISLSVLVGIFHFFMPLIGLRFGEIVLSIIKNSNLVIFVILAFVGIQMIVETFKNEKPIIMKTTELFLFAFAVSLDSFSVGITLTEINTFPILSSFLFAITSLTFTLLGLSIGNKIKKTLGSIATIVGGLVLVLIGFIILL